jgi:hypothetical protein
MKVVCMRNVSWVSDYFSDWQKKKEKTSNSKNFVDDEKMKLEEFLNFLSPSPFPG